MNTLWDLSHEQTLNSWSINANVEHFEEILGEIAFYLTSTEKWKCFLRNKNNLIFRDFNWIRFNWNSIKHLFLKSFTDFFNTKINNVRFGMFVSFVPQCIILSIWQSIVLNVIYIYVCIRTPLFCDICINIIVYILFLWVFSVQLFIILCFEMVN